jgi:hypothetical protein
MDHEARDIAATHRYGKGIKRRALFRVVVSDGADYLIIAIREISDGKMAGRIGIETGLYSLSETRSSHYGEFEVCLRLPKIVVHQLSSDAKERNSW